MAGIFGVSLEAFWMWKKRGVCKRKLEDSVLKEEISVIHSNSKRTYGSPRIKSELFDTKGKKVSRHRVNRLMREVGLITKFKRKYVITTKSKHSNSIAENVLNREFKAETATMPEGACIWSRTESKVGIGHHVLANYRRMVISSCGTGLILETHHWMGIWNNSRD